MEPQLVELENLDLGMLAQEPQIDPVVRPELRLVDRGQLLEQRLPTLHRGGDLGGSESGDPDPGGTGGQLVDRRRGSRRRAESSSRRQQEEGGKEREAGFLHPRIIAAPGGQAR